MNQVDTDTILIQHNNTYLISPTDLVDTKESVSDSKGKDGRNEDRNSPEVELLISLHHEVTQDTCDHYHQELSDEEDEGTDTVDNTNSHDV